MTTSAAGATPETVEIVGNGGQGSGRWDPIVGPEALALDLPPESRQTIIQEAANILRLCVPPQTPGGQESGLVVGYVQSGKTVSFTTVAALARDNGYRMVIVVAGTSLYLFGQSKQRLIRDLRLENRPERSPWRHIESPTHAGNADVVIRDTLAEWRDKRVPADERKTVLITVMKHHQQLQDLIDVLRHVNLDGVPTLVVDDEGDRAGLNTLVNQRQESTTYGRLLALKRSLPHHTFLQYTATPQAPLLINIIDVLSPRFAEVLTPGPGYVGGREFFAAGGGLVRTIPAGDIATANNPLNAPPQSLIQAMQLFFLGVAAGIVVDHERGRRSMMVHPSRRTVGHHQYFLWVSQVRDEWMRVLELPESDRDRRDLMEQFRTAHRDLASTVMGLPSFEVLAERLPHALRRTTIREINSVNPPTPVVWSDAYAWILVGGQALDRGYTVEGLTVTYMPRGVGVGTADTVQQRARFFGYKQQYRGYCRIFLETAVADAFRRYQEHEEDIRDELIAHRAAGQPLSEWRRQFFLTRTLKPTRDNVVDIAYQRVRIGDEWYYPNGPQDSPEALEENRVSLTRFLGMVTFGPYNGLDRRRDSQPNLIAHAPLQMVHEHLLTRYRFPRLEDSQKFAALLRLVQKRLLTHPNETCTLFLMASGDRRRRDYENNQIEQLFQGVQYDKRRQVTYPGDRKILADQGITVQVSYLDLGKPNAMIAENVPMIAVWVPAALGQDAVVQPQGGPRP
jgi:Z1 domain